MNKVLIVEDEKDISELIKDILSLGNYETYCVFDGISALEQIEMQQYDLILLDVMLPKLDGFEVLERVKDKNIPIIFLSAKRDIESIIKGLKNGAQDYITKPFEPLELLARVELRLEKKEEICRYKDIEINLLRREVYKDEKKITLSPKEYDLLLFFIKHIGKNVSREKILHEIWEIEVNLETRTIDYHVQQLRKKLDLKDSIITINKIGYRLEK